MSASVNLPLHHKIHKFSSGTAAHPGGPGKRAVERLWCGVVVGLNPYPALNRPWSLPVCRCIGRWRRTFALDAVHELSLVDVVGQLVRGVVVAMGTDGAVQFQRVCVEPSTQTATQPLKTTTAAVLRRSRTDPNPVPTAPNSPPNFFLRRKSGRKNSDSNIRIRQIGVCVAAIKNRYGQTQHCMR